MSTGRRVGGGTVSARAMLKFTLKRQVAHEKRQPYYIYIYTLQRIYETSSSYMHINIKTF